MSQCRCTGINFPAGQVVASLFVRVTFLLALVLMAMALPAVSPPSRAIVLVSSDPPYSADFTDAIALARSRECAAVTFHTLGSDYAPKMAGISPRARAALTAIALGDIAGSTLPTSRLHVNAACAALCEGGSTAAAFAGVPPPSLVILGRGVTEWLAAGSDAGAVAMADALAAFGASAAAANSAGFAVHCLGLDALAPVVQDGLRACVGTGVSVYGGASGLVGAAEGAAATEAAVRARLDAPCLPCRRVGAHAPCHAALIPPRALDFLERHGLGAQPAPGAGVHGDDAAASAERARICAPGWWRPGPTGAGSAFIGVCDGWTTGAGGAGAAATAAAAHASSSPPPHTPGPLPRARPLVAVLGGAFDPPTAAHTLLALEVLGSGAADEVWLVPCGERPDKPSLSPHAPRCAMLALAVAAAAPAGSRIRAIAMEAGEPRALASADLLERLTVALPSADFALLIGADLVNSLRTWRRAESLLANAAFLVARRPGASAEDGTLRDAALAAGAPWPAHATEIETSLVALRASSTDVRALVKKARADGRKDATELIVGLVCPAVAAAIRDEGLYE